MTHARFEPFGGPVPRIGGFVAIVRRHVPPNREPVALAGRLVTLLPGAVTLIGDLITPVTVVIALVAGVIPLLRRGTHAHDSPSPSGRLLVQT